MPFLNPNVLSLRSVRQSPAFVCTYDLVCTHAHTHTHTHTQAHIHTRTYTHTEDKMIYDNIPQTHKHANISQLGEGCLGGDWVVHGWGIGSWGNVRGGRVWRGVKRGIRETGGRDGSKSSYQSRLSINSISPPPNCPRIPDTPPFLLIFGRN